MNRWLCLLAVFLAGCSACATKPSLANRCDGVPVCAKSPKPDGVVLILECKLP